VGQRMETKESQALDARFKSIAETLSGLMPELSERLGDLLDLAAGGLASLIRANQLGYKDRTYPLPEQYYENLCIRVHKMGTGTLPQTGAWLAGYFLNSALLRIGAAREKLRGVLTALDRQKKHTGPPHRSLSNGDFDVLHQEYRSLKHDLQGLRNARGVTYEQTIEALDELVCVLDDRRSELSDPASGMPRMVGTPRTKKSRMRHTT
jgi:hypothetical protein